VVARTNPNPPWNISVVLLKERFSYDSLEDKEDDVRSHIDRKYIGIYSFTYNLYVYRTITNNQIGTVTMNQPNVSLAPKLPLLGTKTVDPIQIYIDQELVPRIEAGRYKAFVRDPELLFFGTGLGMTSGSTKPPITSFPAFVTNEITEMRYLLPYLNSVGGSASKEESYIVHLISEMEIDLPQESYEEPTLDSDLALKARLDKGKKSRPVSSSAPASNAKKGRKGFKKEPGITQVSIGLYNIKK
jgi:hypothetical protein